MVQGCLRQKNSYPNLGQNDFFNVPMAAGDVSRLVISVISIPESILVLLQIHNPPCSLFQVLRLMGSVSILNTHYLHYFQLQSLEAVWHPIFCEPFGCWLIFPWGLCHHFWGSYLHHCCRHENWLLNSPFLLVKPTYSWLNSSFRWLISHCSWFLMISVNWFLFWNFGWWISPFFPFTHD